MTQQRQQAGAAKVIDLADHAAARAVSTAGSRPAHTLILEVATSQAAGTSFRHLGVVDTMSLASLRDVVCVAFDIAADDAPAVFVQRGERVDVSKHLYHHLRAAGDVLEFRWGLWEFTITVTHRWPRDDHSPRAVCLGGDNGLHARPVDLQRINAQLANPGFEDVLSCLRPEVAQLLRRGELADFLPLLHAIGVRACPNLAPETRILLGTLPLENDKRARDTFWAIILGLACLRDTQFARETGARVMEALGHEPLLEACADSLDVLASVGGYGAEALAPVERIDLYRELLHKPE
ncbi:hypothetical protein [Corynebacterium tapiri]|uniref:Uncharacterized protein n=1 Tax=Corynebacterium tapiri TaxID=1448266 RepID=A0A5C4U3C1_9CORY|nr:hypothetical protein [Corynebacterium tapiri]TNL94852.1 hypothetical protein FHE74_10125 [Corynebacterium tapiri]